MKRTVFQHPELRDANDNIIQQGTYGKSSPLVNSTNDGVLDYINNNLEALYDAQTAAGNAITTGGLTVSGKTTTGTLEASSATVSRGIHFNGANNRSFGFDLTYNNTNMDIGWNWGNRDGAGIGLRSIDVTGNTPGSFSIYARDGSNSTILNGYPDGTLTWDGNNILTAANYNSYALPLSGGTVTGLTVTGETSVPTASEGNSSKAIANTEYVQGELTNYLPLSGGTMSGTITITTKPGLKVRGNDSYLVLCGASSYDQGAHMLLNGKNRRYNEGTFGIVANDGSGGYRILTGRPDGRLTWDGNNILTAANYNSYALPLSGGTLTGAINTANNTWNKLGDDASFGDHNIRGKMCVKSENPYWYTGIAFFNQSDTNVGEVDVNNAFNFNKPVKENGGFLVPIGVVQAFAGSTTPQGWLLCDGSAVSRTDYAALYAVIGTTYGAGDGSTTFNLPNLVDKFVEGSATAGTVKSAGLPNIAGYVHFFSGALTGYAGNKSLYKTSQSDASVNENELKSVTSTTYDRLNLDASKSSTIYGNSNTVQPPALTMRYIIKY